MVRIEVKDAIKDLNKAFKNLSKELIAEASASAINKSILLGRTAARTEVKSVYNIPQRYLSGVGKINATPSYLVGMVTASAKPIPMDAFSPKFSFQSGTTTTISRRGVQKTKLGTRGKSGSGVSIEIIKGQRKAVSFAFMLPTSSGRVFARGEYNKGGAFAFMQRHKHLNGPNGNDSVKPLSTVSVHGAVINKKVENKIASILEPAFQRNYVQQLERLINRM